MFYIENGNDTFLLFVFFIKCSVFFFFFFSLMEISVSVFPFRANSYTSSCHTTILEMISVDLKWHF